MRIEDEIKTNKFEDNYHRVVVNLTYTYGWLNNVLRVELEKHNLTHQQFNVLRILRGQHPKPATINLIKDRMLDKMSDASRIVDRLVQKKLVSRCTNEKDRRAVDIHINKAGLAILAKLDIDFKTKEILKNNISDEETVQLSLLLDKLRG